MFLLQCQESGLARKVCTQHKDRSNNDFSVVQSIPLKLLIINIISNYLMGFITSVTTGLAGSGVPLKAAKMKLAESAWYVVPALLYVKCGFASVPKPLQPWEHSNQPLPKARIRC
jgi:hypothetical protein